MKGFTHQEIWLDRNGSPKTPTMAWVKGLFGIHTEINGGKYFVVTHIPTGKGVFYFNIPLNEAVVNIDKKFADIENMTKKLINA